jgi:hypothetical protein
MNFPRAAVSLYLFVSVFLLGGCGGRDGDDDGNGGPAPAPGFESLTRISADLPQAFARFGSAVAVDGDVAVVGAPLEDDGGIAGRGAAYIFRFSAAGTWDLERRLVAPDGAVNDQFGSSVAVSGGQVVVGAPLRDEAGIADRGGAYVFRLTDPVTATWELTATLVSEDGAVDDRFGSSVDISADSILVGAPFRDQGGIADEGGAYVFRRTDPPADIWEATALLTASDGEVNDRFGSSVAINDGDLIIGAPLRDQAGISDLGAAYVFRRTDAVDLWSEVDLLLASDGEVNDRFGSSVALDGDDALIGAPFREEGGILNQGAAYVFRRTDIAANTWTPVNLLTVAADDATPGDQFGTSVAIDGGDALIGAPFDDTGGIFERGAAYHFRRTDAGVWERAAVLFATDGEVGDRFGFSVALSGDAAMIAAPFTDPLDIVESGAVYPFRRP